MDYSCLICGSDGAERLESNKDWLKAVCHECGPYKIDRQVIKILDQGRKLHAAMMKKWIAGQYDLATNEYPLITPHTAIWAN